MDPPPPPRGARPHDARAAQVEHVHGRQTRHRRRFAQSQPGRFHGPTISAGVTRSSPRRGPASGQRGGLGEFEPQRDHRPHPGGRLGRREGGGGSGRTTDSDAYSRRAGISLGVESLSGGTVTEPLPALVAFDNNAYRDLVATSSLEQVERAHLHAQWPTAAAWSHGSGEPPQGSRPGLWPLRGSRCSTA